MRKYFYIYIVANHENGTLYIGMTSNLKLRIFEHKEKLVKGFTKKHNLDKLVYFEIHDNFATAKEREDNMKAWKRQWKLNLIHDKNPEWKDLYLDICFDL